MKFALMTIALGAAVCFAYEGAAQWKWSEKGQGSVTIKGVCSIDPDQVSCWDKSGKRNPALAKAVADDLAKNSTQVEARFGGKNRYLIADIKNERNGLGINFATDNGLAYQTGKFVLFNTPANLKSGNLTIAYRTIGKKAPKLEPKEGAKFFSGEMSVEVSKIVPSKTGGMAFGLVTRMDMPTWRIYLDAKGGDLNKIRLKPITKDGKPFVFVDGKGRPIPGETAPIKDNPAGTILQLMRPLGGDGWYIDTNIDPNQLKAIEFQSIENREHKIENIPLDPAN